MNEIRKCVFPVAGYGTRFLPVTKAIPKEMLPILTKPLIQYGVEEAMNAGVVHMTMVTSKYKGAIRQYFEPHLDVENSIKGSAKEGLLDEINDISRQCDFSYVEQKQMLGLGHAIYTSKSLIGAEPFAVILPDDLCINNKPVLQQMTELYMKYPGHCIVAIEEVPKSETDKYGIISGLPLTKAHDVYRVKDMVEKPSPKEALTNLAIIGRYILTPEIFDTLESIQPDKSGEIQITDALSVLASKGKVLAYKFQGERFDCGNVKGFLTATNYFSKREGLI